MTDLTPTSDQVPTVPDPGSPAAFIHRILADALAAGDSAAAARFIDWDGLDHSTSFATGSDVQVAVTYRHGDRSPESDVVRLDRVWQLADAGATLTHLGCPDDRLPVMFVAAAMVVAADGTRHDLVVIDRRGGSFALAERAVIDGQLVGKTLRQHVLRFANAQELKRLGTASRAVNADEGPSAADHRLATGVSSHLMEDPTRRGLDQGRPLLQWSYKTVENGTETIVAVSDPEYQQWPLSRVASGGIREVTGQRVPYGTCARCSDGRVVLDKPEGICLECWRRENPPGSTDLPTPFYEKVHRARSDDEMDYADRQQPWQASATQGAHSPSAKCSRILLLKPD